MKRLASIALISLALPFMLCAQATSQVSGVVSDPSGAVIPSASVELENLDTNTRRTATADSAGNYAFLQVVPGKYRITVKASGFRTASVNDVQLLVNNPATVTVSPKKRL